MRAKKTGNLSGDGRVAKTGDLVFRILLGLCVTLAVTVITIDSFVKADTVAKISAVSLSEFAPNSQPVSPGAHEEWLALPNSSMDAKWWVLHTENLMKSGGFRVRGTSLDNAPIGREVHWSSSLVWLLAIIAEILAWTGSRPAWMSVPEAALFAGPIMLVLSLAGLSLLVRRRFGWAAAALFAAVILTNPSIYHTFYFGEADHHGIVMAFAVACVLCLLAGGCGFCSGRKSSRTPPIGLGFLPENDALVWFRLSGVLGAAALWVSAATAIPILCAAACGGVLAAWMGRREKPPASPDLWRTWGISGCVASLAFYALEYFPDHMGWRLEVNHPLYAFAWIGGGFLMARVIRRINGGRFVLSQASDWLRVLACAGLVALPPVLIVLWPQKVFWVSDRFLLSLHNEYILEFQNMFTFIRASGNPYTWAVHYGWPFFALVGTCVLWWRGGLTPWGKRALALLTPPVFVMQALALYQVRWASASMGIWSLCILILFVGSEKPSGSGKAPLAKWGALATAWFALVFSLTPQLIAQIDTAQNCLVPPIKEETGNGLILRDIAHRLIQSSPGSLPVVLTGPNSSTELAYFGGIKTLGTLYWENMPGLKRAASIFAATDEKDALKRLTQAGVTHIVVPSWDNFAEAYARLLSKAEGGADGATFFKDILEEKSCPQWLRPFCYPIPTGSGLDASSVKIFAVIPEQNEFESYFYRGIYHLEAEQAEKAKTMFEKAQTLRPHDERVANYLRIVTEKLQGKGTP